MEYIIYIYIYQSHYEEKISVVTRSRLTGSTFFLVISAQISFTASSSVAYLASTYKKA